MKPKAWDAELYEARHGFVWRFGEGVVELLNPQPGERILDLGCGTGQLTAKIASSGADVVGLDASPAMIGQARQNYPKLRFVLADAAALPYENEFDAVFSNAALHWMLDRDAVASGIARALKQGGRFVAEFGGKGNIRTLERAIEKVTAKYHGGQVPPRRTYFPGVGEYAAVLEERGLEVRFAQLFDRPTPLEGEDGMANWLRQFKWYYFEGLRPSQEDLRPGQQEEALREVIEELRPSLHTAEGWYVDYRRLRVSAFKT
jgi:trans-aconitate 2-methyltransferase